MATDLTLIKPDTVKFVVPAGEDPDKDPEKTYHVEKFCFLKSLMMLELVGALADEIDVASIFVGQEIRLDSLVEKLPVLLRKMRPTITRILALTLIKNRELERVDREGASLDEALVEIERTVKYRLDIDNSTELLGLAIERIGIQNLRRNFPTLLAAVRAG